VHYAASYIDPYRSWVEIYEECPYGAFRPEAKQYVSRQGPNNSVVRPRRGICLFGQKGEYEYIILDKVDGYSCTWLLVAIHASIMFAIKARIQGLQSQN
jgi:hypothetical protein